MNPSKKKDLIDAYKRREIVGGIYAIRCTATDRRMIELTTDLQGAQNRFHFSIQTNTCLHPLMQADFKAHGAVSFSFEVLETVPKKEEEATDDYKEGLTLLRDCLREDCPPGQLYA